MTRTGAADISQPDQPACDGQEGPAFPSLNTAMPATAALRSYLLSVIQISSADTASLLLCSTSEQHASSVLHEGMLPPVPELDDENSIRNLVAGTALHEDDTAVATDRPIFNFQQSSATDGYLIGMSISRLQALMTRKQETATGFERRKSAADPADSTGDWMVWIGLCYSSVSPPPLLEDLARATESFIDKTPVSAADGLSWTLALGAYLAWEAYQLALITQDPVSQLPGRVEFQACLQRELDKGIRSRQPVGLLLINPDEFGLANHRLGREQGDAALQEIARRLAGSMRSSDRVFRYGGAVFGVVLPGADMAAANAATEKLRHVLTKDPYLGATVRFGFSAGVAVHENFDSDDVLTETGEILRRADQALNVAKLSGGAQSVSWNPDGTTSAMGNLDRLSGIFTADTEKDYRNMLLLWDTITVISSRPDTGAIASEFVDRIGATLKPERVGLFGNVEGEQPRLLAANLGQANGPERISGKQDLTLSDEQRSLIALAGKHMRTERLRLVAGKRGKASKDTQRSHLAYAVPLVARDYCLGCLYIDGPEDTLSLDTSDLIFLDALANQIAVALDRAELALHWKQEKERESQRLRAEVQELRQSLQHSRLVYESPQMDGVLETLKKVAPTDVTVLITGESGTGKEMLARALHEMSARSAMPIVTVDCGAIAHSLMEAELFGHVKGAYTGAQGASPGRILQAENGTLFLDEIGEIPLEIQAKLLRFLQEKEFTPVGGTRSQQVDVRIVTATNRDLADEVARGLFRADLYYRLHVVTVTAPPLRERPIDILPLARYFLEKFSVEYGKGSRSLTANAETALLDYPWPGNVRELQHRILQAVVMSERNEIDTQELRLATPATAAPHGIGTRATGGENLSSPHSTMQPADQRKAADTNACPADTGSDPWTALREALRSQIVAATGSSHAPVPLGRWLAEDLVLAADRAANGTASRASTALGMAETTFRRRHAKVKHEFDTGLLSRTAEWSAMQPVLSRLVAATDNTNGEDICERARRLLLEEVMTHAQHDGALGAVLMGVTAPTYRRWTATPTD
jgi:diguanylate cyclase (GGDEF)-like protein